MRYRFSTIKPLKDIINIINIDYELNLIERKDAYVSCSPRKKTA